MSFSEMLNIGLMQGFAGLSLFAVLLLMGLGLAIIFGQMGVINNNTANKLRPAKPCIRPMFSISEKLMRALQRRNKHQANTADPALPVCWCCPLEGVRRKALRGWSFSPLEGEGPKAPRGWVTGSLLGMDRV